MVWLKSYNCTVLQILNTKKNFILSKIYYKEKRDDKEKIYLNLFKKSSREVKSSKMFQLA